MRWTRRRQLMLVTGASGFVGRHLVGQDAADDWQVVAPSSRMLDIERADQVSTMVGEWRPQAVVHLAYRKHDRRTIVQGSANVARAAAAAGAHLVHLSSDVVFGGRDQPYTESDPPGPVNDYGTWKAEAEAVVASVHPSAVLVRTSLVYGTDLLAPIQHDVEEALFGRSSMAFFTDEVRCPVHAGDLARAITVLAGRPEISGPLHVTGPQAIDRAEFARLIARWMRLDHALGALRTSTIAESGMSRPARVVLDSSRAAGLGISCRPVSQVLAV